MKASKTKLMKSSHGIKGDGPDHMEDLLTAPEQVHGIAEAIKEIDPEEDRVDKYILKRILSSEDDADSESNQSLSKSGRRGNRMTQAMDMDNFIQNLHHEQRRHKSKSLTTIFEMQNNEIEDHNNNNDFVPAFGSGASTPAITIQ